MASLLFLLAGIIHVMKQIPTLSSMIRLDGFGVFLRYVPYSGILFLIALIILALGLFLNKKAISLAAIVVCIILLLVRLIAGVGSCAWLSPIWQICAILYWVFVFFLVLRPNKKLCVLGFSAAAILIIKLFVAYAGDWTRGLGMPGTYLIPLILATIVLTFSLCFDFSKKNYAAENTATPGLNTLDKIAELKDLVDNGIITQEEFDAKKKQLLNP